MTATLTRDDAEQIAHSGPNLTIDPRFERDVRTAVNSGQQVLFTVTPESGRLTCSLGKLANTMGMDVITWDCVRGLKVVSAVDEESVLSGRHPVLEANGKEMVDPLQALQFVDRCDERGLGDAIFVFYNLYNWLDHDPLLRQTIINSFEENRYNNSGRCHLLYLVQPIYNEHPEHIEHVWQEVRFPLPGEAQVGNILEYMAACSKLTSNKDIMPDDELAAAIRIACLGLTYRQIEDVLSACAYEFKGFPREIIGVLRDRKANILGSGRSGRYLQYIGRSSIASKEDIVGMERALDFVRIQSYAYLPEAYEFKFELPRGILLVGPYGTGKTLLSKAVSGVLEELTNRPFPGYVVNVGGLFDSLVGSSEANVENLINILRAHRGCVAVFDEMEKLLPDTSSRDSHVVDKRVSGRLMRYLSEKTEPVDTIEDLDPTYVIGTVNSAPDLNGAFFRRFDQVFGTDLPDDLERDKIIDVYLRRVGMTREQLNFTPTQWLELVQATREMSGDEISNALEFARKSAFAARKTPVPTFEEVLESVQEKRRCCVSVVAAEDVQRIRQFCATRAVPVGRRDTKSSGGRSRRIRS